VHLLLSLQQQIPARLHLAVQDARDEGHTWTKIAEQYGTTPATVRRRYTNPRPASSY
jgi:predicted transcriptional regulator